MSTGLRSRLASSSYLTAKARFVILAWVIAVVIVGFFSYYFPSQTNDAAQQGSLTTLGSVNGQPNAVQAGSNTLASQVGKLNQAYEALSQRLKSLEGTISGYEPQFRRLEEAASRVPSRQAVERAGAIVLATQVKSTREQVRKLKALQADWEAKMASLLTGDSGRRIAGSPTHLDLVAGLLDRERPTADQIVQWELQLEQLGTPVEQSLQDEKSKIAIVPEHAQQLTDLSQQVAKSLAEFERQQLLVEAVTKETAKTAPATTTLDEVLRQRRTAAEQARASQIASAKAEAEKAQTERLAAMEKETIEAQTKRKELKQQAEQAQADQLAKADVERIAEETRIKEAKQRAVVAGLKDDLLRVEEAIRQAQLERDFQRDMPDIETYLVAFTANGFKHRQDGTKGPASLGYLKGEGVLMPGLPGLKKLLFLAAGANDRPHGAIPNPISTNFQQPNSNTQPIERAQQLLLKYGDLMVKKGMLAP